MPSYVIYARKSTESEDRQVLSIDSQVRELKTLAMQRGISVAEVLTEAHSAKAPGRPVFGALMRRVNRGEIRGVVCWKMDRLARNHLDTGAILQALADGKLEQVVTSDRAFTRDGNDRFMGNFELGMATKYIDDLRANVRRGNRARFHRGWPNFVPPLGYLNDKETKTVVKDAERFELVRRMWDLLLTGAMRPSQIQKIANEKWGFRTRQYKKYGGNPLKLSLLYHMFGNSFYMGVIRLRSGETYVGAYPPMVTPEEFTRAQEILGRPGRPRPTSHEFPFTGLLRCGTCDGAVTAEEHVKPSGRRYVYYRCARNRSGGSCAEPAAPERLLEAQIIETLERLTIPKKTLAWALRHVERATQAEVARQESARAMLEESLAAVNREAENLLTLKLRDMVTDAQFAARKREIEDRKVRLEVQIAAPARPRQELNGLTIQTLSFATRAVEVFRTGTGVQRRMILEAVTSNSKLRSRKLLIQLKTPFQMIAGAGGRRDWYTTLEEVRTWIRDTTEYFAVPDFETVRELAPPSTIMEPCAA